jgi:O-6-methylguanine DNA methyltransferase
MMTFPDDDFRWRTILRPPAPPAHLAASVVASIRERDAARGGVPRFDIAATAAGIVRLRPGTGATHAESPAARHHAERARRELADYFGGLRSYFTVPVDLSPIAPFQRAVLDAAQDIPFGDVRSYSWIAETIGSPKAVRAVGTALGRNPVPIVIPCHRVLRSDGALGGYAFGLDMKRRFLELEHETPALVGSTTARVVCRHGCSGERRIAERNRVVFASVAEARSAGYRPCKMCLGKSLPSVATRV